MRITGKAAKALETLRAECGQNWRMPSVRLVSYDSMKKSFSDGNLAHVQWNTMHIDTSAIDVDGIAIGYSREIVPIAVMMGGIDYDPKQNLDVLFLPLDLVEGPQSTNTSQKACETLIGALPVLFDERSDNAPVKTVVENNRSFWWRPEFVYVGGDIVADDLAYIYCRNRFLDLIDTVWNNSFIIRPRVNHSREKSVKAISRASKIANLLLLDKGDFNVFEKKGKCPAWQISSLNKLDISAGAFSSEMNETFAEVARLQDVADFWCTAADYYGWALRLSTDDLEDDKIEDTKKRIATMAELIDLESYLDAYEAGVPASDILA